MRSSRIFLLHGMGRSVASMLILAGRLQRVGHRPAEHRLYYPESELARRHGAESPEPTPDPRVAYSDLAPRQEIDPPDWP